jgi:hypothetical protein
MFQVKQMDSLKDFFEREMLKLSQYNAENYYPKKRKRYDSNIKNEKGEHRECKRGGSSSTPFW